MSNNFLWNRVLGFISKRERCEKEVLEYLRRLIEKYNVGVSHGKPLQIDEIISKLKSLDFLNKERFTKAYVHDSINLQQKGKFRIKQELKNKGIKEEIIDKFLNEIGKGSEEKRALEFAKKRYALMKNLPILTVKRRLFGQLLRRGFGQNVAMTAIDKIVGERYN
jgi:regulatory protein